MNQKKFVANRDIAAKRIFLVGSDGEKKGEFLTSDALRISEEEGLDLVMVSDGDKPVCRIMDLGKFLYEQKKKSKKGNAGNIEVKEIKIGFQTDQHYIDIKSKQARKFLERGDKVKFSVHFKGREIAHRNIILEKCLDFFKTLEDVAQVESMPKIGGDNMNMILAKK